MVLKCISSFSWGRSYTLSMFKCDLMSGLTLASLIIPQSIGYANLPKLNPQYGLYTNVVPPLVYTLMGNLREITIGPVAVVSLLLSTMVEKIIDPVEDPTGFKKFVFTATLFAGTFQAAFGLLRLGFLIDFLSHSIIVGFIGGAAIVIGLQKLKGLLGFTHFTNNTDVVSVVRAVWRSFHEPWSPFNFILGCSFLIFILFARFLEAIAVGRSFAANKGYHIDGNKEMVAIGLTNILGSLTSCYVATGSFSRTAINVSVGCETAISNVVMALTVILALKFLTRLLYYTPTAILASIILSALPGLIDINGARNIYKVDKYNFLACFGTFLGVLFTLVEIGLLIAAETSEDLTEWKTALESALAQAPSAALVMGQNAIFRNDQAETVEGGFDQWAKDKQVVRSLVVGRPILLALEDIDGTPSFLEKALNFMEEYGCRVEGVLRQAVDVDDVEHRFKEYEQGKDEFSPEEDAHIIADCIKYVLRELPSSMFPQLVAMHW